jgi:4-alpha-glucanotransferase
MISRRPRARRTKRVMKATKSTSRRPAKSTQRAAPELSRRSAGVLLHVTSLPGPYGIGDLGPAARKWIDLLAGAKQTWWQTLPLTPPGDGASPYQSLSAFAGNPMLISPDDLVADGLLRRADLRGTILPNGDVDFARVGVERNRLLTHGWERFQRGGAKRLRAAFDAFRAAEHHWLDDFALFMSLREAHGGAAWTAWPRELASRKPGVLRGVGRPLGEAVDRHAFVQFLFFRQLAALRAYARDRGVGLIGDLPIFVSADSADVWAHPRLFQLDRAGRPQRVAGVPPDFFSADGQRWGNPLYDWDAMRRDGYRWWADRCRAALAAADVVRIDHFRGFEAYWSIAASEPTAKNGRWVTAPGHALFRALRKQLGGLPFIAEDLGVITPPVEKLRDDFALPGMRVIQFGLGGPPDNPYLPHNHVANAVVYTGTHDNDTTAGWWRSLPAKEERVARTYADGIDRDPAGAVTRLAWSSVARTAIVPMQDVLGLGSVARMNTPGTPEGNWRWRATEKDLTPRKFERLAELTERYGRAAKP